MKNLMIRGELVTNDDADVLRWMGWQDITCPLDVASALAEADGDDLTLLINSPGGDMTVGTEIYSLLRRYPGRTVALVQGFAASAATLLLQGATVRQAEAGSLICVHNPSMTAEGDYRDLSEASDSLKNAKAAILDLYAQRATADRATISRLMDKDIWISAGQAAADYGLIDEVLPYEDGEDEARVRLIAAAGGLPMVTKKMQADYAAHVAAEKKATLARLRQRQLELT